MTRTVTSVYILNPANQQIAELNGAGQLQHSNIYAPGGRLLATYDSSTQSSPGYHFNLTDWLGTKRMQTTSGGNQQETCMSYPSGDGLICAGGTDATEQHFTGKDRDVESGLDYFYARYYSSNLGRFMTPDWAGAPTAVPYANFGDPQSLNLYAYVRNNPIGGFDADGHCGDPGGYDCVQEGQAENPGQGNFVSWDAEQYMGGYGTGGGNYWARATKAPPKPPGDAGSFQCSVWGDNTLTNNFSVTPLSAIVSFWPEGAGGFGHIGIGIGFGLNTFGYATALDFPNNVVVKAGAFLLPIPWEGALRKDQDTYPDGAVQYLRIPITFEQADAMQQAIDRRQANESVYNLIFHNCAEFVEDVLHAGGFAGVPGHSVFFPRVLWSDLTQK